MDFGRAPALRCLKHGSTLHLEQLDIEHQRRIGRNTATLGADGPVPEVGRYDHAQLPSDLHPRRAPIEAGNHLSGAEREGERSPSDRRIELPSFMLGERPLRIVDS